MLETIVQSHERLSNYLSAFREGFKNRPQYRHFQAYVVGLIIYLDSRNLAGLSRAIPDGKSASSLYRFVEQVRWELLNRRTRRALQSVGRRGKAVPVFLAIDDSLVEKSSQQMAGVDSLLVVTRLLSPKLQSMTLGQIMQQVFKALVELVHTVEGVIVRFTDEFLERYGLLAFCT